MENKDKLCGGGPKTGCLMCKAIRESREMTPIPEPVRIKGIVKFLADQKEKKTWKDSLGEASDH
eukprot:14162134-Heterocapsa_arctica.AAC.1